MAIEKQERERRTESQNPHKTMTRHLPRTSQPCGYANAALKTVKSKSLRPDLRPSRKSNISIQYKASAEPNEAGKSSCEMKAEQLRPYTVKYHDIESPISKPCASDSAVSDCPSDESDRRAAQP